MNDDDKFLSALLLTGLGKVVIPSRTYRLSAPLRISRNVSIIDMEGVELRTTREFPAASPVIDISGSSPSSRRTRVTLRGVMIEGENKKIIGIKSSNTFRLEIDHCNVNNIDGTGISIEDANDFWMFRTDVRNCGARDGSGVSVFLLGRPSPVDGLPPGHTSMNTVKLMDCTIERYRGIGVVAGNQTILRMSDVKIHGSEEQRESSVGGIDIFGSNRVLLNGDHQVLGHDFDVRVAGSRDVVISNQISSLGRKMKLVSDGSGVLIQSEVSVIR